jgi:hypothetical protein
MPGYETLREYGSAKPCSAGVAAGGKVPIEQHYLHLLNLADWGLEMGLVSWAGRKRYARREQVNLLFGWKPKDVMSWLFSNPNGPDGKEQRENLQLLLDTAADAESAADHVLETIWDRQVSQIPALRP